MIAQGALSDQELLSQAQAIPHHRHWLRPDTPATSSPQFASPPASFGSIDDTSWTLPEGDMTHGQSSRGQKSIKNKPV
jgi:hypothetical protein